MRLKKNNVSLDVINFANPDNVGRLQAMVDAANEGADESSSSHFLDVPIGCTHITDVMITSPILQSNDNNMMGGGGGGGDAGGQGDNADPLIAMGIDPNLDPEMAAAIRMSLEEAKQQEQ